MSEQSEKRGRGRPSGTGFKPTAEQRELVMAMAGLGIRQEEIAKLIKNPKSEEGISPMTLRQHFREELDQGMTKADAQALGNLLKLTAKSAAAAIFWAKTRRRWRTADRETGAAAGPTPKAQLTEEQIQRRIEDLAAKALKAPGGKNVIPFRPAKKSQSA